MVMAHNKVEASSNDPFTVYKKSTSPKWFQK
jgi:hypothetical protein